MVLCVCVCGGIMHGAWCVWCVIMLLGGGVCTHMCLPPLPPPLVPAGQHIALKEPHKEDHIGLIDTKCSPMAVAQDAIDDARWVRQSLMPGWSGSP